MEDLTGKVIDGMDLNVSIIKLKWDGIDYRYKDGDTIFLYGRQWEVLKVVYHELGEESRVEIYLC